MATPRPPVVCNIDEEGRFGGPERRIVLVAAGLKVHGIDTLVLIPCLDSEKFEAELQRLAVRYEKRDISRLTLEPRYLLRYVVRFPLDLWLVYRVLRTNNVEVVHVNGSYQFRSALAAVLARSRVIWHINDAKVHWVVKFVCRALATRISQGFIFSSAVAERYYFPHGVDRRRFACATIPPPVELQRFAAKSSHVTLHRDQGRTATIVTLTGINPDKGNECFIETAAAVHRAWPNVTFVVAAAIHKSHQRHFEYLQRRLAELAVPAGVINFVGFVDDVPSFLEGGDVFLYTSNTESGPAAVWEAMAAGLPVVTTEVGAIPDILVDGTHALIAKPRHSERLAELTLSLLADRDARAKLGTAGRMLVEQRLGVWAAAEAHANLYKRVAEGAVST